MNTYPMPENAHQSDPNDFSLVGETLGLTVDEQVAPPSKVQPKAPSHNDASFNTVVAFSSERLERGHSAEKQLTEAQSATTDLAWDELPMVLSHYHIGTISQMKRIDAPGSTSQRKIKILLASEQGVFLLKRQQPHPDTLKRLKLAHTLQHYLNKRHYPVPQIIRTARSGSTAVRHDKYVFELMTHIRGTRYARNEAHAHIAGVSLGQFHSQLSAIESVDHIPAGTFHDSPLTDSALSRMRHNLTGNDHTHQVLDHLERLYEKCSQQVAQGGYLSWPVQIGHGDWRSSNLLFHPQENQLVGILGLSAIRLQPPLLDVVSGLMHLTSMPLQQDTSDVLQPTLARAFLRGYTEHAEEHVHAGLIPFVPELLAEAMILQVSLTAALQPRSGIASLLQSTARRVDAILGPQRESLIKLCEEFWLATPWN